MGPALEPAPGCCWAPRAGCLWCLVGFAAGSTAPLELFGFEQILSEALGLSGALNLASGIYLDSIHLQCLVVLLKVSLVHGCFLKLT